MNEGQPMVDVVVVDHGEDQPRNLKDVQQELEVKNEPLLQVPEPVHELVHEPEEPVNGEEKPQEEVVPLLTLLRDIHMILCNWGFDQAKTINDWNVASKIIELATLSLIPMECDLSLVRRYVVRIMFGVSVLAKGLQKCLKKNISPPQSVEERNESEILKSLTDLSENDTLVQSCEYVISTSSMLMQMLIIVNPDLLASSFMTPPKAHENSRDLLKRCVIKLKANVILLSTTWSGRVTQETMGVVFTPRSKPPDFNRPPMIPTQQPQHLPLSQPTSVSVPVPDPNTVGSQQPKNDCSLL